MSKEPSFNFFPSDFLTGTMLMSNEQVGKYIRLLCLQHQQGHLSEEDMLMICGEYDRKIFSKFKQDEQGNYYNDRLDEEKDKRKKFVESRRNNLSKKEITHTDNHMGTHMDSHMEKQVTPHMEYEYENINDIFNYWNSKEIIKHRELTNEIEISIKKSLEKYTIEQIKICIDRYAEILKDTQYFWHYKWSLKDFLNRKDGISSFTDEGSKWNSYQDFLEKPKNTQKEETYVADYTKELGDII